MRIRFLEGVAGELGVFYKGDELEVPDGLAQRWISAGAAEPAVQKRFSEREKAVSDRRERAVES